LAEFLKQKNFGAIFVSRTKPGVTREEHPVKGDAYQVVDIPPGFTHSITNVGIGEMVTLFWSSEVFDPNHPDTFYLPVDFAPRDRSVLSEDK
jgi:UDP-2-acetamido-2,6-beta-L-arabino-hexul-4-ose reductase